MKKALLVVFCLGLLGMSANDWRRDPSDELAHHLFHHEIPATQYCVVNNAHLHGAIDKLQSHALVELPKDEIGDYVSPCKIELKGFSYLVRALDVSGGDRFTLYGYRGNLYVTSGVLGTSAAPRCTALVLSTKFAVSHVYVSYFVAK